VDAASVAVPTIHHAQVGCRLLELGVDILVEKPMAASLAVLGVHDGVFDLWVPVLIFSPFIVDATVTVLRRILHGQKFWQAHREHYYQRLVLVGWGHRKTMLVEYALMLATGTTAVLYVHVTDATRLAILATWFIAYVALAQGVRKIELKAKSQRVAV